MIAAIQYTREFSHELANAASQIVPVLLLAAIAIPHRRALEPDRATDAPVDLDRKIDAAVDVGVTALLVGTAFCSEFVALYGVIAGGLTLHDVHLLEKLLFVTGLAAVARLIAPVTRTLAADTGWREWQINVIVWVVIVGGFWAVLLLMNHGS